MMLLDLPPEILELILMKLDPGSFSIMLMTCKPVLANILGSKKLLSTQLLSIPGHRLTEPSTTGQLFSAFIRRASKHAFNGVGVLCDLKAFRPLIEPSSQLWTRPRMNRLQTCCSSGCELQHIIAAIDGNADIHIYSVRTFGVLPRGLLSSTLLDFDGDSSETPTTQFRIVAAEFWKSNPARDNGQHLDRLTALYQYEVLAPTSQRQFPFVETAIKNAKEILKIVTWSILDMSIVSVRNVGVGEDEEPICIAASRSNTVAIAYRVHGQPLKYRIRSYSISSTIHGFGRLPPRRLWQSSAQIPCFC